MLTHAPMLVRDFNFAEELRIALEKHFSKVDFKKYNLFNHGFKSLSIKRAGEKIEKELQALKAVTDRATLFQIFLRMLECVSTNFHPELCKTFTNLITTYTVGFNYRIDFLESFQPLYLKNKPMQAALADMVSYTRDRWNADEAAQTEVQRIQKEIQRRELAKIAEEKQQAKEKAEKEEAHRTHLRYEKQKITREPLFTSLLVLNTELNEFKTGLENQSDYQKDLKAQKDHLLEEWKKLHAKVTSLNEDLTKLKNELSHLNSMHATEQYNAIHATTSHPEKYIEYEMTCSEYSASTFCKAHCNHEKVLTRWVSKPDMEERYRAKQRLPFYAKQIAETEQAIQALNTSIAEAKARIPAEQVAEITSKWNTIEKEMQLYTNDRELISRAQADIKVSLACHHDDVKTEDAKVKNGWDRLFAPQALQPLLTTIHTLQHHPTRAEINERLKNYLGADICSTVGDYFFFSTRSAANKIPQLVAEANTELEKLEKELVTMKLG